MIENYVKYLDFITQKLNSFFERQKPYICCKEGCALCCLEGEYPFSYIEFEYLKLGMNELCDETKKEIQKNVKDIKEQRRAFKKDGIFLYKCPFLINNSCSVYKYRGIICRSFGLIAKVEGKKPQIPFCCDYNLNYASVYDKESQKISGEMFKETGFDVEPLVFNTSYKFLTNETFEKAYGFEFKEKRRLIDWFED